MTKTRQWSALTAVAVLIVFAGGWFLLVKPQRSHAADLKTQTTSQQDANQRLQAQIAQLQAEQKDLPKQQQILQKFSTRVPDNAAEPTIIRQLSAAAAGSGVDLQSMTPGTPAPFSAGSTGAPTAGATTLSGATPVAGTLYELPLSIAVTGSYPNLTSFFRLVEKLPRSMLVGGWQMEVKGDNGATASSNGAPNAVPPGTINGTLSTVVFFSPPAGATVGGSTTAAPTTTTGTATQTPQTSASGSPTSGSSSQTSGTTTPTTPKTAASSAAQ